MPGFIQSSGFIECFCGVLSGVPTVTAQRQLPQQQITPRFLGVGQTPPETQTIVSYSQVRSDMAGQQLAFDDLFAGAEATTQFELVQWDEDVLQTMATVFNILDASGNMRWNDVDVGTAMMTEGFAIPLWFRYARRNVPAMDALSMPDGYHYYGSRLVQFVPRAGNKANSMLCVWHHRAQRDPATGIWRIRDKDLTAVATLPGV